MLLRFGADPTLLDRQSRTPVDVLKRNKNFKAIEKINSHLEKLAACSKDLSGTASSELTFFGGGEVWGCKNWFCDVRYKLINLFLVYEDGNETPNLWKTCFLFFGRQNETALIQRASATFQELRQVVLWMLWGIYFLTHAHSKKEKKAEGIGDNKNHSYPSETATANNLKYIHVALDYTMHLHINFYSYFFISLGQHPLTDCCIR